MAEIYPNDIGLATFADVGDVEKLKTSAKNLVDALNEIYQNGTQGGGSAFGKQWYVDGENNVILGENNLVHGSNNFIIGSNNIIVGDNINIISSGISKCQSIGFGFGSYDMETGRINYQPYSDEEITMPIKAGDKVVISIGVSWADAEWNDWTEVLSPKKVVEVLEVDTENKYIRISDAGVSAEPPDEVHTEISHKYISMFIPLIDEAKIVADYSNISFGGTASGNSSFAGPSGTASGASSFSGNAATADGKYSAAFGNAITGGMYAFAANSSLAYGDKSASVNSGQAYAPCSFAAGSLSKVYGRALKCTGVNWAEKKLTIDSSYDVSRIKAGSKVIVRCYNSVNTVMFDMVTIKYINGHTIYLTDEAASYGTGAYAHNLQPDGMIFVIDTLTSYSNASMVGGIYSIAGGKYSFADGWHVVSANDGAVIFGKYGINTDSCSLALANGTAVKTPGLAFKVLSDGSVHADKEYTSPCADYAEYFEWADGNPNNEDRVGYFVKLKDGKIVLCNDFDTPLGIVSATPAIIGDSGEMHWQGKYITDDFGRIQYHDVPVPAETDEDGNTITEEHIETQPILNPDWNPEQEYIPRKDRPEWSAVGVLGKLIVYDDGILQSGDICRCGASGKAVKSIENGYTVLKRIADDKVLIWFKG